MGATIEIDDELMGKAMSLSGLTTKSETVEEARRLLVRLKPLEAIRSTAASSRGTAIWKP